MNIPVCYIIKQMREWASSAHLRMQSSKPGRPVYNCNAQPAETLSVPVWPR